MPRTTTIEKIEITCHKHSMNGGGGSYRRIVVRAGDEVEVVSTHEGIAKIKFKKRCYFTPIENLKFDGGHP